MSISSIRPDDIVHSDGSDFALLLGVREQFTNARQDIDTLNQILTNIGGKPYFIDTVPDFQAPVNGANRVIELSLGVLYGGN